MKRGWRRRRPRRVVAVEPVATNLAALRANMMQHGFSEAVTVVAAALGASPTAEDAKITVYPRMPGNSTLDPAEKLAVQSPFMRAEMFADATTVRCEMRTLSELIGSEGLDCVHLLKIDVEGSELKVLQGIEERHWPLVQQVVAEVVDVIYRVAFIKSLLTSKGFRVITAAGEPRCNLLLYATRNSQ